MGRLAIREYGPAGGEKVLWLHGWMGHGGEGETLAARVEPAFRWMCPDLPGHGESAPGDWTLAKVVEEVARLRRSCRAAAGYSMGGRLLMMAAASDPGCAAPLVVESAFPGTPDPRERAERLERDRKRAAELQRRGIGPFLQEWEAMAMWGGWRAPARSGDPEAWAEALVRFSSGRQPDLHPWLRWARSRILWLAGARDTAYGVHADWVRSYTPHRVRVRDAGHNVHGQDPAGWAEDVRSFLIENPETQDQ